MIINLPQSIRIITIVIKEIDREDSNFIDQLANRVSDLVKQSMNNSTV